MENMISYCGINCAECLTYLATQKDDDKERQKVADMWGKMFGVPFKIEDINCDGCHTKDGRLFGHCSNCHVRSCGQEKSIETCAHCADYSCKKVDELLEILPHPTARKTLEKINSDLS